MNAQDDKSLIVGGYPSIKVLKPNRSRRSKLYLPLATTVLSSDTMRHHIEFNPITEYVITSNDINYTQTNSICSGIDYDNRNTTSKLKGVTFYPSIEAVSNYVNLSHLRLVSLYTYKKTQLPDLNGKKVSVNNQLSPVKASYSYQEKGDSYEITIECAQLLIASDKKNIIALPSYHNDYLLIADNVLQAKQNIMIKVGFNTTTGEVLYYINNKPAKSFDEVCTVANALLVSLCMAQSYFFTNDHFRDFHDIFYKSLMDCLSQPYLINNDVSDEQQSKLEENQYRPQDYVVHRNNSFFAGEFNQCQEAHYIAFYLLKKYKDLMTYDMSSYNKVMFFFQATNFSLSANQQQTAQQVKSVKKLISLANKGKTNEFKQVFLYGYNLPKSITKELFTMRFMCLTPKSVRFIHQLCERFNIDHVRTLLQNINRLCDYYPYSVGNSTSFEIILLTLKYLIQMGYPFHKIVSMYKRIRYYRDYYEFKSIVNDTMRMHGFLVNHNHANVFVETMSLIEYHDTLSYHCKVINDRINKAKHPYLFEPVVSKRKALTDNGLTVRPLNQIIEMRDIAYQLHICVDTYMDAQLEKSLEIFVVVNDAGKYIACLEVKSNRLRQAKLYNNVPITNNPQVEQIVLQWAKANKIYRIDV